MSITDARKRFFELADEVQTPGVHYTLTEKGKPRVTMVSAADYEGLMETLDIISEDPQALTAIRKSQKEFAQGKYITLADLKKEYGISRRPVSRRTKRTR